MIERTDTLHRISGLPVSTYELGGVNYFVFGPPERPIKTVCTYRKARVFAEGVAAGRSQEKPTRLKYQDIVYRACNLLDTRTFPCPDCGIEDIVPRIEALLKRRVTPIDQLAKLEQVEPAAVPLEWWEGFRKATGLLAERKPEPPPEPEPKPEPDEPEPEPFKETWTFGLALVIGTILGLLALRWIP